MPLYGEDAWDHARWGLMGGELPGPGSTTDWFTILNDTTETDILSVAEFSLQNLLLAGTSPNGLILSSSDAGSSWSTAYDSPETRINDFEVFGNDIYAATGPSGLIYRSSDGSTWTLAYDSPDTDILTLKTFSGQLYAAGTNGVIYRSADGTTWTLAYDAGLQADTFYDLEVFKSALYAASGDSLGLIFRSTNGTTWTLAYDSDQSVIQSLARMGNDFPDGSGTPAQTAEDRIFAGSGDRFRIYKSGTGTSWELAYDGLSTLGDVRVLHGSEAMMYAGSELLGVLYRSDNGIDWSISYDSPEAKILSLDDYHKENLLSGSSTSGAGDLLIGSGSSGIIYNMDNFVEADHIPDMVTPDGGETITTDTFRVEWSFEDVFADAIEHWDLDEVSGSRYSWIGDNPLQDIATVTSGTGKFGNGAQFTAVNSEYLTTIDSSTLSVTGDFTIAVWVKLDSKSGFRTFVSKWNQNTSSREYLLDYDSGNDRFRFLVSNDGVNTTSVLANNFGSPLVGIFHFIVAWHDATADTINIQVNNGTADSASHTTGINDGTAEFRLGSIVNSSGSSANFMDGILDSVTLWKQVLTTEERTRIYNEGDGRAFPLFDHSLEYTRNFSTNREWNTAVDDEGAAGPLANITGAPLTHIVICPKAGSCVAHWHLDELSGTRNDFIGSNNLTDNATVTQADGATTFLMKSAQFTAANSEYLSIVDNAALSMGDIDMMVTCWVYLDSKSDFRTFVSKWNQNTSSREYLLDYNSSTDRFRFTVSNDGVATTSVDANTFGSPPTATWHYLAAWHDSMANTINIQVNNGTADSASHTTGINQGSAEFRLGSIVNSSGSNANFMDGRIDEVTVWKTILPQRQRAFLYNGGLGRDIRATTTGNKITATWNVLPIVDSSDMKLRARVNRITSSLESSWNETDDVFTLQNGPC